MKRHESLAPLSREHHNSLILAQLLKKNAPKYTGLPEDINGKIIYAKHVFQNSIREHFRKEETILDNVSHCNREIEKLSQEIKSEHHQIEELFMHLDKYTNCEEVMHSLGLALEAHIRKEERVLFPLIQQHCSEKELKEIGEILH